MAIFLWTGEVNTPYGAKMACKENYKPSNGRNLGIENLEVQNTSRSQTLEEHMPQKGLFIRWMTCVLIKDKFFGYKNSTVVHTNFVVGRKLTNKKNCKTVKFY